jgi:hypothetical protein
VLYSVEEAAWCRWRATYAAEGSYGTAHMPVELVEEAVSSNERAA